MALGSWIACGEPPDLVDHHIARNEILEVPPVTVEIAPVVDRTRPQVFTQRRLGCLCRSPLMRSHQGHKEVQVIANIVRVRRPSNGNRLDHCRQLEFTKGLYRPLSPGPEEQVLM